MRRIIRTTFVVIALLVIVYFLGPKPAPPALGGALPGVPGEPERLEAYIGQKEALHRLRPGNEARIVWAGEEGLKTPYSVVYLHGFSASEKEGDPVHRDFAKRNGYNLYLSRLDQHGIDTTDALENMTAQGLWEDAKEALAIGKQLGNRVILMGTSTGGTLALLLAAQYPNDVAAVINLSPNIAINEQMIGMLDEPWGLMVARLVKGGKYNEYKPENPEKAKYWYTKYRLEAVVELENLVEHTMKPETFARIHQPVLNLYFYKNEKEQDPTVKVSAILDMHRELGTPDSLKRAVAIPNAGAHVLGSSITSGDVPGVEAAINSWWEEVNRNRN
ncbi:alpha/beta hydrolase [Chitinophaga sp. GCM10012297]|uniref:Alpha/beta hydrolase n=1 Tax=Chitinophaga chungangae TaxID=2821488 RepID=A0ABS3YGU8_9BACT|nr:alpha/beta hydrolase [Chitinophaga chungangae]MBO9153917.1 alpha/beta hydrolase [Chitinophaga chungangae]